MAGTSWNLFLPALLGCLLHGSALWAAVFTVDSVLDEVDLTPGNGVVDTASGGVTLRGAVMEANALAGDDTIELMAGTYRLTIPGPDADPFDMDELGDLDVTETSATLTIRGAGAATTIIDASAIQDRIFHVHPTAGLDLSSVTITGGEVIDDYGGGGIRSVRGRLTLARCVITANTTIAVGATASASGGGILSDNLDGGALTIMDCLLSENMAHQGGAITHGGPAMIVRSRILNNSVSNIGGGIFGARHAVIIDSEISGNSAAISGGGVRNFASVTMTNCTVSNNVSGGDGGGLDVGSSDSTLINCTISGNRAEDNGGGVWLSISASSVFRIIHCTITGNMASAGGGIRYPHRTDRLHIQNTIIALNTRLDGISLWDVWGRVTSLGGNLVSEVAGSQGFGPSDLLNERDPGLDTVLRDNGGFTPTHALLPGSPAIDAAIEEAAPETDQRGVARPQDGNRDGIKRADIGAYEFIFPNGARDWLRYR